MLSLDNTLDVSPTPFSLDLSVRGGVRQDGSGRKWYKSIGLPLAKRRPDFQLDLSVGNYLENYKLLYELAR